ncbi:MAG: hypothetical protein FJ290_22445 [Planctomycetes bacterium]|nr:hypothetical protein [Planctomycetota bacterium]
MGKTVKINFRGEQVEGELIPVERAREEWTEAVLADHSVIRLKPVILRVVKIPGKRDSMGNPVYLVQSNNVMSVESPEASAPSGEQSTC